MTTELCDICGVNLNSSYATRGRSTHLVICKRHPNKDEVELVLCSYCHDEFLRLVSKHSRKEWKQEAKQKLRELFP